MEEINNSSDRNGRLDRRGTYQPQANATMPNSAGKKPPLQFKPQKGRVVTSAQGVSAFGANTKPATVTAKQM